MHYLGKRIAAITPKSLFRLIQAEQFFLIYPNSCMTSQSECVKRRCLLRVMTKF